MAAVAGEVGADADEHRAQRGTGGRVVEQIDRGGQVEAAQQRQVGHVGDDIVDALR
jgi:hypothetical protein